MTPIFTADFSYVQDDGSVQMAGLADDQFKTKQCVLLQKTIRPSAQDRRVGQDQVHITVNDQEHSAYGGIKQVLLNRDNLVIRLSPKTSQELGTEEQFTVAFAPNLPGLDRLSDSLRAMLATSFFDQR